MTRLLATGASLLPSFPQTLEGEGYCANLRQRMVPRYRRASTFGTAANALDGSATPQFSMVTAGRAEPHHILPESGWVSIYLRQSSDLDCAIELLHLSYEIATQYAAT